MLRFAMTSCGPLLQWEEWFVNGVLKNPATRLFKKVQMRGARNRGAEAYLLIRWSKAIERNEAGGPFSTACLYFS
jgi:hypothetical protein